MQANAGWQESAARKCSVRDGEMIPRAGRGRQQGRLAPTVMVQATVELVEEKEVVGIKESPSSGRHGCCAAVAEPFAVTSPGFETAEGEWIRPILHNMAVQFRRGVKGKR